MLPLPQRLLTALVPQPQLDRDIRKLAETRPAPREPESDIDEDAGSGEDEIDDSDDAVVVHEERESGAAPGADQAENRAAEEGLVGQQPRPGVLRKKRVAVPVRVEPKVFFANERTLLSWLRFVSDERTEVRDLTAC